MGSALVMTTVSEESIGLLGLKIQDPDHYDKTIEIDVRRAGDIWVDRMAREEALKKHPRAFWDMHVPYKAVWQPPEEPSGRDAINWHWDRKQLAKHREVVRKSLEDFLNAKLAQLDQMVRTGWFIVGRARVKVTLREVPHNAIERAQRRKRKAKAKREEGRR